MATGDATIPVPSIGWATTLASLLLWTAASLPAEAAPSARVFVLDPGAPALVSVDLAAGKRLASLPLEGQPTWLVQSDDGRYLVALDYGPGEDKATEAGRRRDGPRRPSSTRPASRSSAGSNSASGSTRSSPVRTGV